VAAWTPTGQGPASALAAGVIDLVATSPDAALDGADLVVLAAPPSDCLELLDRLAGPLRAALDPDAVLTDVASTKGAIVARAETLGLRFVGGHPMAGRETTGFAASSAQLLVDRPWVIVPSADEPAVERVENLAAAVGARPLRMSASDHDSAVAAISHLPLVVAAALVEAVAGGSTGARADWPILAALAATGWRDMTRLARGDVPMGAGIAATNGPEIAARIRDLIAVLESWSIALSAPDPDEAALADRLRVARERLLATDR
jgi:prephenate dehydrogenase